MLHKTHAVLGLALTLSLAACGAVQPTLELENSALEAQALVSPPTSTQKQQLRAQSGRVARAGLSLLATNYDLSAQDVAPALQNVCLRGADALVIKGRRYSLKALADITGRVYDVSFPPLVLMAGARGCRVSASNVYALEVAVVGRAGWTVVNGQYPLDDPENLNDAEQARNGKVRSSNVYKLAQLLLIEDFTFTAQAVAQALEPWCLKGANAFTISGKTITYPSLLPPAPIGLSSCTVKAVGDQDFQVTVTTANGSSYVYGPLFQ